MMLLPRPSLWNIFATWFMIGAQSFGGGSSTLYLIHQACIERGWMAEAEFTRDWALVQVSPGINLVKLTMLAGHRLRGWPGLIGATVGLLLPSAGLTVLMTAGFAAIRGYPLVQAALKGILPATIGLGLAMAAQMAQPLMGRAYQEGPARLSAHIFILLVAALLMGVNSISPALVLLVCGAAAILLMGLIPAGRKPETEKSQP